MAILNISSGKVSAPNSPVETGKQYESGTVNLPESAQKLVRAVIFPWLSGSHIQRFHQIFHYVLDNPSRGHSSLEKQAGDFFSRPWWQQGLIILASPLLLVGACSEPQDTDDFLNPEYEAAYRELEQVRAAYQRQFVNFNSEFAYGLSHFLDVVDYGEGWLQLACGIGGNQEYAVPESCHIKVKMDGLPDDIVPSRDDIEAALSVYHFDTEMNDKGRAKEIVFENAVVEFSWKLIINSQNWGLLNIDCSQTLRVGAEVFLNNHDKFIAEQPVLTEEFIADFLQDVEKVDRDDCELLEGGCKDRISQDGPLFLSPANCDLMEIP